MENNETETVKIEPATEPPKDNGTKPAPMSNKEKKSRDEKSRKKDNRSVEQILKSLNGETAEDKLTAMCKKYIEAMDENRKLQASLKQSEKCILMIQREKEQIQSEKSKAILTRSRLESLCRELQRQNNAVKEESLMKIREEEEKRKEVSAKFQSTLAEITALMAETNEKNVKLHEDNIEIHKKFKSVFDEMDIREQHFEGMHQMMKHELQVAEAKLAKVTLELTEEKEKLLKDKNTLLLKLAEYQAQIVQLQQVESNLRSQVEMYTDKYDEFQSALTKSNEVFGGFNEEMEKMSKKILKLEKETQIWKTRWEKSHAALLEMAADKQTRDSEIVTLNKKCSLLHELCNAFKQERVTLLAQLKEKTSNNDSVETNQLNAQDNQVTNESSLIKSINTKIEEQTKESKTETNSPESEKVEEINVSESSTEVQDQNLDTKIEKNIDSKKSENVNEKTVNNEEVERLVDVTSTETEEIQSRINDNDKTIVQENSLNCKKEETILQVPVEAKDSTEIEIAICSPKESKKSDERNVEETSIVVNPPNAIDSTVEPSSNNHLTESPKKKVNVNEEKKVSVPNGEHHIDKTSAVIPNGEVRSNTVTNKKHKEGKKKRK